MYVHKYTKQNNNNTTQNTKYIVRANKKDEYRTISIYEKLIRTAIIAIPSTNSTKITNQNTSVHPLTAKTLFLLFSESLLKQPPILLSAFFLFIVPTETHKLMRPWK